MENSKFLKIILTVIAVGIWMIVLQNFNSFGHRQDVYVRGGYINADVDGTVDVRGSVDVDNMVDINMERILGYKVGCRKSYSIDGEEYVKLDVSSR